MKDEYVCVLLPDGSLMNDATTPRRHLNCSNEPKALNI